MDSYDTAGHSDLLASVVLGTPISLHPSVKLEVPHGAESLLKRSRSEPELPTFDEVCELDNWPFDEICPHCDFAACYFQC